MHKFITKYQRGLFAIFNIVLGLFFVYWASHIKNGLITGVIGGFLIGITIEGYLVGKLLVFYQKENRQLHKILTEVFVQLDAMGIFKSKFKVLKKFIN